MVCGGGKGGLRNKIKILSYHFMSKKTPMFIGGSRAKKINLFNLEIAIMKELL